MCQKSSREHVNLQMTCSNQTCRDAVANLESIMTTAEAKRKGNDLRRLSDLAGHQLRRVIENLHTKRIIALRKYPSRAANVREYYTHEHPLAATAQPTE
jgi:hypothetical protein